MLVWTLSHTQPLSRVRESVSMFDAKADAFAEDIDNVHAALGEQRLEAGPALLEELLTAGSGS